MPGKSWKPLKSLVGGHHPREERGGGCSGEVEVELGCDNRARPIIFNRLSRSDTIIEKSKCFCEQLGTLTREFIIV